MLLVIFFILVFLYEPVFGTFAIYWANEQKRTLAGLDGSIHAISTWFLKFLGSVSFLHIQPFGRHIFQIGPSGLLTSIIMIGWPLRSDWDVFLVRKIASLLDSTVCIGPTFSPFLPTFNVSTLQMYDSIFKLGYCGLLHSLIWGARLLWDSDPGLDITLYAVWLLSGLQRCGVPPRVRKQWNVIAVMWSKGGCDLKISIKHSCHSNVHNGVRNGNALLLKK